MAASDFLLYIGFAFMFGFLKVTEATECPDGFVSHQGICYKEFGIRASWNEAMTYCEAYGAELAMVTNEFEQIFLSGYLQRLTRGYFNSGIFWIGATDMASEGSWVWNKTTKGLTYTHWKPGEPNNASTLNFYKAKYGGEDCMTMSFTDNFNWNDNKCEYKFNFVCEKRAADMDIIG